MALLVLSFIAGVLTVAAPCILPLLPVIVGGSLVDGSRRSLQWMRPIIITLSLAVSVIVFTLLLKATTALLGVPSIVWQILSGTIVVLLGTNLLLPNLWAKFAAASGFEAQSNKLLGAAFAKSGVKRDVLTGAALGPVFSSCSPTYALIVAAVLPVSFIKGVAYLLAYAVGLSAALLLVAYAGQAVVRKAGWLSNPSGWFRKTVGVFFIVVGISVVLGLDKKLQAYILEQGWYNPIANLEKRLDN